MHRIIIERAPAAQSLLKGTHMTRDDRYWFPAKRYGWGWGLPPRWRWGGDKPDDRR
jgi:hypothetical protein